MRHSRKGNCDGRDNASPGSCRRAFRHCAGGIDSAPPHARQVTEISRPARLQNGGRRAERRHISSLSAWRTLSNRRREGIPLSHRVQPGPVITRWLDFFCLQPITDSALAAVLYTMSSTPTVQRLETSLGLVFHHLPGICGMLECKAPGTITVQCSRLRGGATLRVRSFRDQTQ